MKDQGSLSNPGVTLRNIIRGEAQKEARMYDQALLGTLSDVGDGKTIGMKLDGFAGGEVEATWATPVAPAVGQRLAVMALKGGQQFFVTGVLETTISPGLLNHNDLGNIGTSDHHVRYADSEAQAVADTQIATHTAIADAHHAKYTDAEAVAAVAADDAYVLVTGDVMSGDLTFANTLTGFDYGNQGLSLNLGSKDVADDAVIPFIDFYSGSTVIAARIISSTDSGTSYTGGLRYQASAGHTFLGSLVPDSEGAYNLGSAALAWGSVYALVYRDESGNQIIDASGDWFMRGDQHFFNYGTETNSYLQHSTGSNYFRLVQAGSEAWRLTHDGTTTYMDLYGTAITYFRKVEGTSLRIANDVANEDIHIQTDNGSGLKNRIFIDGAANTMAFYNHDGTEIGRWSTSRFHVVGNGSASAPSYSFGDNSTGWFRTTTSGGRINGTVAGTARLLVTATPTLAPAGDNNMSNGASTLRWKDVWAVDTSINSSDERFKENIQTIDRDTALALVRNVEPISFTRTDRARTHFGFGAFQTRDALAASGLDPSDHAVWIDPVVSPSPDDVAEWESSGMDPEDSPKAIRQSEFLPVAWRVLQYVVEGYDALEARVAALEAA